MTLLLMDSPALIKRRRLIASVADAAGPANIKALWLPSFNEDIQVPDAVSSRVWTHGTAPGSRLSARGNGFALSFNGTTDYLSTPDTADLRGGNGVTDNAFSIFAYVNITDTAGIRTILSKDSAVVREYALQLTAADLHSLYTLDLSASAVPRRDSDAVATQAAWISIVATYSGVGGASSANGIVLYENGVLRASTATNQAAYVAMEGGAAALEIGSVVQHTQSFFSGSMACVGFVSGVLNSTQALALHNAGKANGLVT